MERMTVRRADNGKWALANNDGANPIEQMLKISKAIDRLAEFEDICPDPALIEKQLEILNRYADSLQGVGLNQMGTLAALFREGRLFILPCKIGDTVYQTDGVRVYESTVRKLIFDTETIAFDVDAVNRTVFTTREAAETALLFGNKKEETPNA